MPVFAWIILAVVMAGVLLIWYLFEALNGRITMNLNDLLSALQARAQAETDATASVVAALSGLHNIITQLRDEIAQQGLSSDSAAKFQAVLDTLDQNKASIAAAVIANTDASPPPTPEPEPAPAPEPAPEPVPAPAPAGDDTVAAPSGDDDTISAPAGDDTASAPEG